MVTELKPVRTFNHLIERVDHLQKDLKASSTGTPVAKKKYRLQLSSRVGTHEWVLDMPAAVVGELFRLMGDCPFPSWAVIRRYDDDSVFAAFCRGVDNQRYKAFLHISEKRGLDIARCDPDGETMILFDLPQEIVVRVIAALAGGRA